MDYCILVTQYCAYQEKYTLATIVKFKEVRNKHEAPDAGKFSNLPWKNKSSVNIDIFLPYSCHAIAYKGRV